MQDAMTVTVMDIRTNSIFDLGHNEANVQIGIGDVIETVPSDPQRAAVWVAALRERVMAETAYRGDVNDIPPFEDYEAWCVEPGFNPLPVKTEILVLYMLCSAAAEVPKHELLANAKSITRIHDMTRHPPRHLVKHATDAYYRALKFAKAELKDPNITEVDRRAPQKAIEMFPFGIVPMRWGDL